MPKERKCAKGISTYTSLIVLKIPLTNAERALKAIEAKSPKRLEQISKKGGLNFNGTIKGHAFSCHAVKQNSMGCLKLLHRYGADLTAPCDDYTSAMHSAMDHESTKFVQYMSGRYCSSVSYLRHGKVIAISPVDYAREKLIPAGRDMSKHIAILSGPTNMYFEQVLE